jgi:hypothetical protein
MPKDVVKNFFKGVINVVEPQSIPEGAASDSLNWSTIGDRIELRRGMARLGSEITGTGLVLGLRKGIRRSGVEVLFTARRSRKFEYYDTTTQDWIEIGSNVLPAAAAGDEIAMEPYDSLAGAQLFLSSRNSSIYKIMVANPGSYTELSLTAIFRGKIRIKQNRMFLWDQQGSSKQRDISSVYGSYIDKDELTDYSQVSAEARHSGNGAQLTFTGTLAFKGVNAQRTCFFVTFTDGTETFTDNYDGTLTGTAGGTGTINYTTGQYSITFAAAPAIGVNNITSTYYYENTIDQGIADFSKSSPRTAGQGFFQPQFDGGALQNILALKDVEYCIHEYKTWALTLTNTDTNATNLPFRVKIGIPNWRAACESPDGIYYIDNIDKNKPAVYLLEYNALSQQVEPKNISANLDLSAYSFDKSVLCDWGRYLVMACRTSDSTVNNRLFVYDKLVKCWDIHDYYCSVLEVYNGTLVGGDSVTDNVFTLFSGEDDDDSLITNFWQGNLSNNGIDRLKKAKRFKLQGAIGPDQKIKVSLSFDNGPFVEIGSEDDTSVTPALHTYAIEGDGSYVDHSQRVSVGAPTIGSTEVGGGSPSTQRVAYPYEREFKITTDRYEQVMVRFEAVGIGYASVSLYDFPDIRDKGKKPPTKYRG